MGSRLILSCPHSPQAKTYPEQTENKPERRTVDPR